MPKAKTCPECGAPAKEDPDRMRRSGKQGKNGKPLWDATTRWYNCRKSIHTFTVTVYKGKPL